MRPNRIKPGRSRCITTETGGQTINHILLIPLDERPCNYDFPQMLAAGTDCLLHRPPRELLGKKKQPGDVDAIWQWFSDHAPECSYAVVSIDTLLYSGIVPSRLHNDSLALLLERLNRLREIRRQNPGLRVFAFHLIMRNPSYSSSDEEPEYYAVWGSRIHRYGVITHRMELGIAEQAEKDELASIRSRLPKSCLEDYYHRREINLALNAEVIRLASEGVIDFLVVPQDDSSPYGVTAKDQQRIRAQIDALRVNFKAYMYPDADAVANTLLTRAINGIHRRRPLVYVQYASSIGNAVIPLYEDRIVSETVKYQILAAGGLPVSSAAEADIVLLINVPGGQMQDRLGEAVDGQVIRRAIEYDAFRSLIELVEYAEYQIEFQDKDVVVADIAYANGGDEHLFRLLQQKKLLWKVAGYAGWNTSSNTLGTCIPMGMLHHLFGTTPESLNFLALRYIEDVGYDVFVRAEITEHELSGLGLNESELDGPRGAVSRMAWKKLQSFADRELGDALHSVRVTDCTMPWNRMFEAGICAEVTETGENA